MNYGFIINAFYIFIISFVFAFLETQIEGGAGWAKNLPTWRASGSKWYAKLYGKIMGGKELTGYHIAVFGLLFLFMHYPYFIGRDWSLLSETTTLAFFLIITIYEDFMWFIINPAYDFRDFWAEHVWWHKKWFLHLPLEYWGGFIASAILYMGISFDFLLFKEWLIIIALFTALTIIVMILADWLGVFNQTKKK
jgi:hypothetical protein